MTTAFVNPLSDSAEKITIEDLPPEEPQNTLEGLEINLGEEMDTIVVNLPEVSSNDLSSESSAIASAKPTPEDDQEPEQELDPELVSRDYFNLRTEKPTGMNPWVRIVTISVGCLIGGTVAVLFFTKIDLFALARNHEQKKIVPEETTEEDPFVAKDPTLGSLAVGEQNQQQATANGKMEAHEMARKMGLDPSTGKPIKGGPLDKAQQATLPPKITPPSFTPKPRTQTPTVRIPRQLAPRVAPVQSRPAAPPQIAAPPPAQVAENEPDISSMEAYELQAQLGNWGDFSNESANSSTNEVTSTGEVILNPGETLDVEMVLPLTWSARSGEYVSLAKVTQGHEGMPAGTMIAVQAQPRNTKEAQLGVSYALINNEKRAITGEFMAINDKGEVLEAKVKGKGGVFKRFGRALLGVAGNVANNALSSNTVNFTSGNTQFSSNSQESFARDVLSGAASGVLSELSGDQREARNSNEPYYLIPKGTTFQLSALSPVTM